MKVSIYWSFDPNQDRTFYWLNTSDASNYYSHDVFLYWHYGKAEADSPIASSIMLNETFAMLNSKLNGSIKDIKAIPSDSLKGNCIFVIKDMEVLNFTV